ncbi:MAG: molybdopterin-binding protein [Pseudomonadota bacterium]
MKFGPVALADAQGAILAHSVQAGARKLRKGAVLSASDIADLAAAGLSTVTVARLDAGDVHENEAAEILARALVPDADHACLSLSEPFTGRVNLLAAAPGVALLDAERIRDVNGINPMITVATVQSYQQMHPGGMIATVKIISYGVPRTDLVRAAQLARSAVRLQPAIYANAGLIVTEICGTRPGEKGVAAVRARVEALGMKLSDVVTVPHDTNSLANAIARISADLVLILTGSATSDPADIGPSALRQAGGRIERFGMPVDPGNLLFLGHLEHRPVVGLPGCARSPALNGADWVLSRLACGVGVTDADIADMGVGGLLKEIPTRPQPRAGRKPR